MCDKNLKQALISSQYHKATRSSDTSITARKLTCISDTIFLELYKFMTWAEETFFGYKADCKKTRKLCHNTVIQHLALLDIVRIRSGPHFTGAGSSNTVTLWEQ